MNQYSRLGCFTRKTVLLLMLSHGNPTTWNNHSSCDTCLVDLVVTRLMLIPEVHGPIPVQEIKFWFFFRCLPRLLHSNKVLFYAAISWISGSICINARVANLDPLYLSVICTRQSVFCTFWKHTGFLKPAYVTKRVFIMNHFSHVRLAPDTCTRPYPMFET